MASIVLETIGRVVGTYFGGPIGGQIGAQIGASIGGAIEGKNKSEYEGARLETLAVQTSTYGRMIPIVFGTVRISGNVIWSLPIREVATTTQVSSGGKGGGGGGSAQASSSTTTYSYFVTLAIAICEGEVTNINRVWADSELLDLSQGNYRIYRGTETQLPDTLIESVQGVGGTPAYRGMAYVVIEDFPIGSFGNRIPNFTFEVARRASQIDDAATSVESLVTSVMLLPGSGEFVYDTQTEYKYGGTNASGTFVQSGYQTAINQHTPEGKANVLVALDQLQQTFPNLEWVGLVVNWFGTSMDIATCDIWPCVEYQEQGVTSPQDWSVAGFSRLSTRQIGADAGEIRYGGTPDDASIVRLLTELRTRGLKVFFYPQMLMDVAGKPWRGELTGSAANVSSFFSKSMGYNNFILHYAHLTAGLVDAFAIGTEMRDLMAVTSSAGVFPAVSQMVSLATSVKTILGSTVKVTYAADWSEYHHTNGGWYHLDPLWASSAIDMVGIDAYFPLSDAVQVGYDVDALKAGWTSGEGYDWYYSDGARTVKAPLSAAYAWKNIDWWWNNHHVNPDGSTTSWVPSSKPVWFTEYGYASVDGCANEPNVFVDSTTADSALPRFSRGRIDFMAQRAAITATESEWAGSAVVTQKFLWTWDARPYPYWPDLLNVWADGGNWVTGHWVQGKLGSSHVAAAVQQIMARAGLMDAQIDTSALQVILDGFVLHQRVTARAALNQLMQAFFFSVKESNGKLTLMLRDASVDATVAATECVPQKIQDQDVPYVLERKEDLVLPERLEVQSLNRLQRYETDIQSATRHTQDATDTMVIALSLVLSQAHARAIAEIELANRWAERNSLTLQLPIAYAALEPGDLLELTDGAITHRLRLSKVQIGRPGLVKVTGAIDAAEVSDRYIIPVIGSDGSQSQPLPVTRIEVLDIPALPTDLTDSLTLRFAACGTSDGWTGASVTRVLESGNDQLLLNIQTPATIGTAVTALGSGLPELFDRTHTVDVAIIGNATLVSATELQLLNGSNVAVLGDEIIQFANATLVSPGVYRLSKLLRGRLGTEAKIPGHTIGERFVLLNEAIVPLVIPSNSVGQTWNLLTATFGSAFGAGASSTVAVEANSLKPYNPTNLQAVRSGTGDVTLSWMRRTRVDGGMRDYVDVPLNEASELYEVKIYNGSTPLRTIRVTSPSWVYTSAQQIVDFGTAPTSLKFSVGQLSASIGLGNVMLQTIMIH